MAIPSDWSYDQETGVLTAPEGITSIGTYAFKNFTGNKAIIPEGITVIMYGAFQDSPNLNEVILPSTLTEIKSYAFKNCTALQSITIPDSVTIMGGEIFDGCSSLTNIDWPSGDLTIGGYVLRGTGFTEFTVPGSNITLGSYLFDDSPKLKTLNYNNLEDYSAKNKTPSNITNNSSSIENIYVNVPKADFVAAHSGDITEDNKYNWLPSKPQVHFSDDADYDTWKDKFENNEGGNETMPDTNNEMICVSEEMLQLLVTQILTKVNSRIAARIVNTISDESDANHVPSALAVLNFIRTFSPNMKYQTVTGSIDTVTEPAATTIYLQRDSETDPTWVMYLPIDGEWVSIGDTSIDLVNYWSKSEADVTALREQILNETGLTLIKEGIDYDNLFKDNTATKQIILNWLDSGTLVRNTAEGLAALYVELDKRYVQIANLKVVTTEQIQNAVNAAYAATEPEI